MAAYGAAVSLKNTIQRIVRPSPRISLVPSSRQILQPAYQAMCRLQNVLLKLDRTGYNKIRTKVNDSDDRIKQAVWEFEDLLDTHFTNQILPQLESERDHLSFSLDLQSLRQSVDDLVKRLEVLEEDYLTELANMPEEEGEPILWRIDSSGINSNMVGPSAQFENVKKLLIEGNENQLLVTGMAGVGKTTLAKKLFEDSLIHKHFKLRAWIKVGRKCEFNETFRCILAQVDPNTYDQMLIQGGGDDDEKLVGLVKEGLKDKKCLIVFDDVWQWDKRVMGNLLEVNVRILLTSRQVIEYYLHCTIKVNLLDPETSMKLLGKKVFPDEGFPPQLEKLGKKIASKCEGLPLMIVTVAELLSKQDKTPKYWMEVANKQHNSVFKKAYDQIYKVLLPSYNYLPQHLTMFFLYCGAFPPYQDIEIHDLFKRLNAEGFLEPVGKQALEIFIDEKETFEYFNKGKLDLVFFMSKCRHELVHYYHLLIGNSNGNSRVHSCWQHVCKENATKIKFLHVLQSCNEVVTNQRRFCAHHNSLFAIKQLESDCAFTARSLLCFGPYHHYPLPIHDMGFKLLKVLDALKVRFYHIPDEILKLICLKYLALTCNNELPASISNLFHLQSLIISQHMSITRRGAMSYMPAEIWDMQELQHIEVTGRDLPSPKSDAALDKLSYLSGVSENSCTREILKRVCNLNKLQIVTVLKPYDDEVDINPQSDLRYISEELQNLNLLKYRVVNPCIVDSEMKNVSMLPSSMFPKRLVNVSLSGLACPWKHMNDIGSLLPNLENLELKHYAFRGPEWDIEPKCFLQLRKLTIEDTDLVRWRVQHGSLPKLSELNIQHCYKLQQFDWVRDPSMVTTAIKLVECNYSAEASANQLTPKSCFDVKVHRDEKS